MSNDRYEKIRAALAMGPTPGPWTVTHELRECGETVCDLVNETWVVTAPGVKLAHWEYDAAYIAACDPDTIRALLDERDALAAENARLREALELMVTTHDEGGWPTAAIAIARAALAVYRKQGGEQ